METSELFGLMFFALLRKGYYDGARQLIETGCVRIPHLLIGCAILQETADDFKTSQLQKEKVLRMKTMCTQQALRITSGIHEIDTKSNKEKCNMGNTKAKKMKISGEPIDHAGRLLLNHGYLKDAIKTENRAYLNDDIVKNVISQIWYRHENITRRRFWLFVFLTLFHFLFLPLLMVNRTLPPLRWLYRQYRIPTMKVLLNAFSLVMIMTALSYMLICDFSDGIAKTDWFIIAWMTSLFFDEVEQVIISYRRGNIHDYTDDSWNMLDWAIMTVYLVGMLARLGSGDASYNASKVLLVLTFVLMCVRFLNLLMISEIIGAKLVMMKKMFVDTFAFLTIMMCIGVCYCISHYAILYKGNDDFGYGMLQLVFSHGFWVIFGEVRREDTSYREPECSFDKNIYSTLEKPRCPSLLGSNVATFVKAIYVAITLLLLFNLLIAVYSHTVAEVHEKSKFYWALVQTGFLEDYSVKSIFPTHFQIPVLLCCFLHVFLKIPYFLGTDCNKSKSTNDSNDENINQGPEFIRVFLYDTNFDVELKATKEAEEQAALEASGDLEGTDEDKFTVIQKKMKTHKRLIKNNNEKTSEILTEIRKMKGSSGSSIKAGSLRQLFKTTRNTVTDSVEDTSSEDSEYCDSD